MRRAWFLRSLLALLRLLEMVDTLSPGASGYCFCYPVALVLSYPREFSGNRSLVWMEDDTPHQFANSIINFLAHSSSPLKWTKTLMQSSKDDFSCEPGT